MNPDNTFNPKRKEDFIDSLLEQLTHHDTEINKLDNEFMQYSVLQQERSLLPSENDIYMNIPFKIATLKSKKDLIKLQLKNMT